MSFRPNYSAGWRQREVEKAKARKETDQRLADELRAKSIAKTENNFPTLPMAQAPPSASQPVGDHTFAEMAHVWRISDEREKARAQYSQIQAEKSRNEFAGVFLPRFRPGVIGRKSPTYEDEDDSDPIHRMPSNEDDEGWNEVKRKAHKGPRVMSEVEMARRCSASSSDEDDADHNGHLFESYRHDHH